VLITPCLAAVVTMMPIDFPPAKRTTVSIAVTTSDESPVGVAAHIYRKVASSPEELVADTDDEGKATVSETACSPDVQYRAEAIIPFPKTGLRWEPCRLTGQIVFVVSPSAVSKSTEGFLKGKIPDGWVVPQGYEPVFVELRQAVASEQWGAAAKLSSKLADQYRSAGLRREANSFVEIALAGAASYAASQLPGSEVLDTLLKPKNPGATFDNGVRLSPLAKKAVANFQTSCGLQADGIVGSQTMHCLPGGEGYNLPSVATIPLQDLVGRPNT